MNDIVKIKLDDLRELVEDSRRLSALYDAGVNNWDGWDYYIDIYDSSLESMPTELFIKGLIVD